MNESTATNPIREETNPDVLREKLMYATETLLPKIPELLNQNQDQMDFQSKMLMNTFQPFLPKLQGLVIDAIENADEERLLDLVEKIEDVNEWLQNNEYPE